MTEVLANYRPISNLKVISKIIEKVVAVSLQKYLEANQLNELLQINLPINLSTVVKPPLCSFIILVAIDKRHGVNASTVRPVFRLRRCGSRYPP